MLEQLKKVWTSISTMAILGGFVLLGAWGHKTHWTLGLSTSHDEHAASHSDDSTQDGVANTSGNTSQAVKIEEGGSDKLLKTESVSTSRVQEFVPAMATVAYNGQRIAQLSTRAEGHVQQVLVRLGQHVKQGDVLALIDSQTVGEAKSDWLQKAALTQFRSRTLQRMQQTGDGVLPLKLIREAEADLREAELSSFMAQQRLMNLGFDIDVDLKLDGTPEELAEQIRYLGMPKPIVETLPKKLATANLIAILAPFDGVVVEQHAVIGEMVSQEKPQFVVADTSTMWVKLSVRREDASKLSVGQQVQLQADGIAEKIETKLSWISAEIDAETRTVQAVCEVNNFSNPRPNLSNVIESEAVMNDRVLRANQYGYAKICVSDSEGGILVPETAVQRMPDQQSVVFVKSNDGLTFEPRFVEVGLRQDGRVQIIDGVKSGDTIVSQGSFILKSELMRSSLVGG